MAETPEAGWYPDPEASTYLDRYWDGVRWTAATRPGSSAAATPLAGSPRPPGAPGAGMPPVQPVVAQRSGLGPQTRAALFGAAIMLLIGFVAFAVYRLVGGDDVVVAGTTTTTTTTTTVVPTPTDSVPPTTQTSLGPSFENPGGGGVFADPAAVRGTVVAMVWSDYKQGDNEGLVRGMLNEYEGRLGVDLVGVDGDWFRSLRDGTVGVAYRGNFATPTDAARWCVSQGIQGAKGLSCFGVELSDRFGPDDDGPGLGRMYPAALR